MKLLIEKYSELSLKGRPKGPSEKSAQEREGDT